MYKSCIMYKVRRHLMSHFLFMNNFLLDFYSETLKIDDFYITSNYAWLKKLPEIKL